MESNFMTTKEKDYVSYIFTKNIKQYKSDVDYKKLFSNTKQEFIPFKTELKTSFVFGKDTCRDNKKNRYFSSVKKLPDELENQCEIDNLLTEVIFKKVFLTETPLEIDISKLIKNKYLWKFLQLTDFKKQWILNVMENFELIEQENEFIDFVNTWYEKIPKFVEEEINENFLSNFMTKSTGLVFATCLLINNNDLFKVFYDNFIEKINFALTSDEVWNFLVVLMKFCDKEQKFKIVKLTKKRLLEIRNDTKKLLSTKNFLKCLGLELEDLKI